MSKLDLNALSDAELEAIASGNISDLSDQALKMIASQKPEAPSTGAVMAEAARKGVASFAGTTSGLGNLLFSALERINLNPLTAGMMLSRDYGGGFIARAPTTGGVVETYKAGSQPVYKSVMETLGTTGVEPQGGMQKIVAEGTEAVTSPFSYLFPPLAATKRMGLFGQTILRPTEQQVIGSTAEAGGQAGEYIGEKMGAPTTGRVVGSVVGGGGGAYTLGTLLKTGPVLNKGWDAAKSQVDKIRGTIPEDELLKDVDNRINNVFIAAGAADPAFMETLKKAASAQQSVRLKTAGGEAVQMPISSLLADNPVINNFIQSLSAKDPVFRAQYGAQFEQAKQALTASQIRLFGDPTKVRVDVSPIDLAKSQARRTRTIDEQIADAYKDTTLDPNVFGQRVATLVASKEDAALKSVKPLYTEAFDIAKQKNVELPASSVDDIFNFVAGEQASDIFKTFPSIYNRVRGKFRPAEVAPSPILTAEGKPMTEGGIKFSAATVEDLDSLKREINKQLRKTSEPADIRLLSELKSRVGGHIDNLDPDFVQAYRNADASYFQKVGLPFNSETLKAVDRKKFVEQIAPAIIGNKSNVDDFIRATGEDGIRVARDAFYDSFSRAALKNDVLDPKAANKWLSKNQGGVSLVPGLEDELRTASNNVASLIAERNRLDSAFKKVAGDQIVSSGGFKNPQELVSKMYSDVNFTNKFMQQYGANKDAVNAARSFMLDDIVRAGNPTEMLGDRTKAAVFNRVFGPTYAQKVQDFALVSERLNKDLTNVPFKGETVPRTPIEQLTGIPPEQIISRIYNPVSGPVYAITSLMSKFWARKASDTTEEKLKALLLNPSDAVKVFQAVQSRANNFDQQKIQDAIAVGKKYGIQWVADAVQDFSTGAARGAVQPMTEE
jgi:hypothetical protein